ncbi:golgi-specific brefeldin a-resistance guanine nucleotide exchange factor 1 (bfa-resistant gef 1) [Moniliophthora roreri MCA 2997]|uniref:Golgi-specific brefeldin a-resistance guanine nucleotide exchange factor 1 (Bfa-resistant gef 1) n=1 Tax=Moniliophthora roreri (strain MCA 2997) TaxID=1381753 RepID=V2X0H7_MONRO|nr:golgi-specific brefeldin a-resistance guanine nucleotide exchange factor 1 (bfa-resistant gef 1) [Moniliophthora roreri MCA 2997]
MSVPDPLSVTRRVVSRKHVLLAEIMSVTSTMRKNSRWASSTYFVNTRYSGLGNDFGLRIPNQSFDSSFPRGQGNEHELMTGFHDLKRELRDIEDLESVPLLNLLSPFFAIIRSPLSTGPITSVALSALHSFFVSGLINASCVGIEAALVELSNTVSHCKFEASDSSGDEVVILKIITVIHDCLCMSGVGSMLSDVEVCEMLETVLTTCCQMRLSEILRRSAENTMCSLVRTVFSKLHSLDPATEEAKLTANAEDAAEAEVKMKVASTIPETTEEGVEGETEASAEGTEETNLTQETAAEPQSRSEEAAVLPPSPSITRPRTEYSLPSILELFRVLVNVLDPTDQQHTDSTRLVALGILNAAFEEAGTRIGAFASLKTLILDPGCKYLFQLARSDNLTVLHAALRAISTMFDTMREHLKLQQELFLAFTIDRLAPLTAGVGKPQQVPAKKASGFPASPRPGTPSLAPEADSAKGNSTPTRVLVSPARGETRDLFLETLGQISRQPSFMIDLYTNYDCDINCENIFERVIEFLTKAVHPSHYAGGLDVQQRNAQYLCLDILLAFVNDMAKRAEGRFPSADTLMQVKSQKKLILTGASRFNAKPKTGLAFLEENGLIYADLSPEITKPKSLARFLKGCTRLDKRLLGDFISRPENTEVLKAFIDLFDFRNKAVAEALRELLETFRLPGESQQIDRIAVAFASAYFAVGPAEIKTEDAVYVLVFSIILLNTDLHNPQVKRRMSLEDYQKNLKGVNGGDDFSVELVQSIYDSIRKREIVMPEEHTGQLGFEYAWKELLTRSRSASDYMVCNSALFDLDMFKTVWKPVISAIAYAFMSFDDEHIIQRSIAGFRQCATLAGRFQLPEVFDFVVVSLSQATGLLPESLQASVPNYPVVDVEGHSVTVSNLSVRFGTNVKGQMAAVVLFNIVNGNGNALREGWTQIFEMFQNLFIHSLLPTPMLQMEDFLGGASMIPLRGAQPQKPAARGDGGLLSALSSYLMTPYGASSENLVPDATDSDIENTLSTIDCIKSCRLDEFYGQVMHLQIDALVAAIRALEALAHERTVAKLKQESDDGLIPSQDDDSNSLPYDPASVFLLETMVSISCQASQHIEDTWPIVFEHLSALLSSAGQYSILLIERAVVSLLRLCLILAQRPSLRDQLYLSFDLLSGLPPVIASSVAEQVISGVAVLVQKHLDIIKSQTEWNLIFAVIKSTISNPEAARLSFELVSSLIGDGDGQLVNGDNFNGLLTLLEDFAMHAGFSVESQLRHGRRHEPLTSANTPAIERGKKSVDMVTSLKKFITPIMDTARMQREQGWRQLFSPLLTSLSRQSANAAREVRHNAIGQLQRTLLAPHKVLDEADSGQVEELFNRVLFPLLDELLRPQVFLRDPQGMVETRLRASALLTKSFMHFEVRESQSQADIRIQWIEVLDLLDRYMNIDKGDQLHEAVPESLKNVLLVMNAAQILVPPSPQDNRDQRQRTLWTATSERLERFLPGFLNEVIPTPASPVTPS